MNDPTRRKCIKGMAGLALAGTAASASEQKPSLTVLSFNILAGGTRRGPLYRCANLILEAGADIVGLQEIGRSGAALAEMTGFFRFTQGGNEIHSRYPLGESTKSRRGVRIEVPGTDGVWMFNTHLRPMPYQPYQLARIPYGNGNPFIETEEEAIAEAGRARGGELNALLADLEPSITSGKPVLLTGDFNEPSHLDWSATAAEAGCCKIPVRWPTSFRLARKGLADAYRAVYPDPVTHPGHTWTPSPSKEDVMDRIDVVYARGFKARKAAVIGESEERADIVFDPFPSDHRAVVAQFDLP